MSVLQAAFTFGASPPPDDDDEPKEDADEAGGGKNQSDDDEPIEDESVVEERRRSQEGVRRTTVSAEVYNAMAESQSWTPPVVQKSAFVEDWLANILAHHMLFKHLDDREIKAVMNAMEPLFFQGGTTIYTEGVFRHLQ